MPLDTNESPVAGSRRLALEGRVAIITGAASGIGRASALLFAQEGASVIAVDLQREAGEELAREIREQGRRCVFHHGDVTRAADCEATVRRAVGELGALHILFNNAGIIRRASVTELVED